MEKVEGKLDPKEHYYAVEYQSDYYGKLTQHLVELPDRTIWQWTPAIFRNAEDAEKALRFSAKFNGEKDTKELPEKLEVGVKYNVVDLPYYRIDLTIIEVQIR